MKILEFIIGSAGFALLYHIAWQVAIGVALVLIALQMKLLLEKYK